MPVPTADHYDQEQARNNALPNQAGRAENSSNVALGERNGDRNAGAGPHGALTGDSTPQGHENLSREEADRLYEERMEEEYAKREGGA